MKSTFNQHSTNVHIDTEVGYGYWEWPDGREGGGLWFRAYELTDYDSVFALPHFICEEIRSLGYIVDASCDASTP